MILVVRSIQGRSISRLGPAAAKPRPSLPINRKIELQEDFVTLKTRGRESTAGSVPR